MHKLFAAIGGAVLLWFAWAAAAAACPYITTGVNSYSFSATQLARPAYINVVAGGSTDISRCSGVPGYGWTIDQPDFSIYYDRNDAGRALEFRTSGGCDTIILVNTGAANWYFDDDDGSGMNARIRLTRPSGGRYDVWVGTYGPSTCNTQLVVETFR